MLRDKRFVWRSHLGFTLIELIVGMVIGLLATLVIMQTFSVFEGQKRTTSGNADAQTNGSIALFTLQRDVQMAGFGLPVFDTQNPPLKCNPSVTVDHDNNAATPEFDLFPIAITDGGADSDTIRVRYSIDGGGAKSGIASKVIGAAPAPEVGVNNNLGCNNGDVVLLSSGSVCHMTIVQDNNLTTDTTHITLKNATGASEGASLSCMGRWNQFEYKIVNNQLVRNDARQTADAPFVSDVVALQAQYGVSATADNNQITEWVDATGAWAAPSVANRNRIKAVHISVVTRNGLLEKTDVTTDCTTAKGTANTGPCAWDDTELPDAAPEIDLSADPEWKRYRYRVYDTIIPLRNMIWSKNTL